MNRTLAPVAAGLLVFLLGPGMVSPRNCGALERVSLHEEPELGDPWTISADATLHYYNICTGSMWAWNMPTNSRFGVVFSTDPGVSLNLVESAHLYTGWTAPGYSYTGTISLHAVDGNDCPTGAPIDSRPFLPDNGFNTFSWNVTVPSTFAVVTTVGDGSYPIWNLSRAVSDHPSPGGAGPPACGTCYPSDREIHSFYYGTTESPLCPGSTLYDGWCDAELVWSVSLSLPVGVQEGLRGDSWARIKATFR